MWPMRFGGVGAHRNDDHAQVNGAQPVCHAFGRPPHGERAPPPETQQRLLLKHANLVLEHVGLRHSIGDYRGGHGLGSTKEIY